MTNDEGSDRARITHHASRFTFYVSRNTQYAVSVVVRPQVINLLVGDEAPSYSFDRTGRLIGAFEGGRNYRRGLDNRVLQKWSEAGGRQRRWLALHEARIFLEAVYRLADDVAAASSDPRLDVLRGWDWTRLQADAAQFAAVYRPVGILPPDQYLALVLQATEGCSHNRCTFCDFYRNRSFRIKSPGELREHIRAVRQFFGPALPLRKSLFLADANALVAPMARVVGWLDVIAEERITPDAGIYSFMDAFDVQRKSLAEWRELSGRDLRRVYIGMETGDDDLLRWLVKPGVVTDVVEAVTALKSAGIAVSVIVMTGIGGEHYAEAHVRGTINALNAMPLAAGDIIYFSPFVDHPGSEYGRLAAEAGINPLNDTEIASQEAVIRAELQFHDPAHPPQCSKYDIREFIY